MNNLIILYMPRSNDHLVPIKDVNSKKQRLHPILLLRMQMKYYRYSQLPRRRINIRFRVGGFADFFVERVLAHVKIIVGSEGLLD